MGNSSTAVAEKASRREPQELSVSLAITVLNPSVPEMLHAYHTSVSIGDRKELSFSGRGIDVKAPYQSHDGVGALKIVPLGKTTKSEGDVLKALGPYFKVDTYDLLRKNCNTFSDCALFYLVGKRLDKKYKTLEQIGADADKIGGLVRLFSGGEYAPNPMANGFRTCIGPSLVANQDAFKYSSGDSVQVMSVTQRGWVDAIVKTIHADGRITVKYTNRSEQKDIKLEDQDDVVKPLRKEKEVCSTGFFGFSLF